MDILSNTYKGLLYNIANINHTFKFLNPIIYVYLKIKFNKQNNDFRF